MTLFVIDVHFKAFRNTDSDAATRAAAAHSLMSAAAPLSAILADFSADMVGVSPDALLARLIDCA
jgi:hypothetical protein